MDLDELESLIRIFESSELSEIEIEEEGRRVCLKKLRGEVYVAPPLPVPAQQLQQQSAPVAGHQPPGQSAPAPQSESAGVTAEEEEESYVTIDSPMVGVFYAAPGPGEKPFVRPGDTVSEGQTVCIVEAMKLMNEVTAKFPAIIEKILVENGEPVEFGQQLFAVRPLELP